METVIQKIAESRISSSEILGAYKILFKLINNIVENPSNPKYRSIRSKNVTIYSDLFLDGRTEGHLFEELLLAIGFTRTDDGFAYKSCKNVDELVYSRDLIQGIIFNLTQDLSSIEQQPKDYPKVDKEHNAEDTANYNVKKHQQPLKKKEQTDSQKSMDELNIIRAEQARKFQSTAGTRRSQPESQDNIPQRRGFFDFLWRNTSNSNNNNNQSGRSSNERNGRRMMTLSDIRPAKQS